MPPGAGREQMAPIPGREQTRPVAAVQEPGGVPRKVKLTVARIDPWSAMKLSFLLSVAFAIATVVASVVVWEVLNAMGVFSQVNAQLRDIAGPTSKFDLNEYVGLSRVVSLSTFVAVVNVVVTMALATLGAVLYNIAGSLVGGLNVTLSDD